ncbi:O-antigen ligase family protein [Pararobbsia silviterrae]|uniref:O-antigen ligase-related domain-containing protein n=1 Tax=Pararobbsia silviterrae TaxID=1792498 RepID=A0A494Y3A8_9BURK|nr:O-antigen ligase family protein [Pararobbsia silviterrae]RKP56498.1 hypothetical protein D7S86_08945 [Pararobbsia silviterrae]
MTSARSTDASIRVLATIAVLAGFSIPVSTALQNISSALLVVAILLIPAARRQIGTALRQPFSIGCLVFYAVFVLGVLWAPSTHAAIGMLVKLRPYLLVPVIFAGCMLLPVRQGVLLGFGVGTLLSVVVSIITALLHHPVLYGMPGDYQVFRTHTYHDSFASILILSIAAFWLKGAIAPRYRKLTALVLAACVVDVFLFVAGRTAQGALLAALCCLLLLWDVRKGIVGMLVLVVLGAVFFSSSNMLKSEVTRAQYDLQQAQKGVLRSGNYENSLGLRLFFWRNAMAVVEQKPVLGHGTGSYQAVIFEDQGAQGGRNPHCDYLWIAVETGVVGVLATLAMLICGLVQASRLASPERWAATLLVVTFALTALLNSYFTDNITGTGFILLAAAMFAGRWFEPRSDATRGLRQS